MAAKYIRSLLTIFALGVAMLGGTPEGSERLLTLGFIVLVQVFGLVAIAAILRRDVTVLNDWKKAQEDMWKEHTNLHMDVTRLLGEMKQFSVDTKERVDRLDYRIERRQQQPPPYRGEGG
jgi:hypothetical protein